MDNSSFNGQDSLNQVKIWRSVPTTSLVSIHKHGSQGQISNANQLIWLIWLLQNMTCTHNKSKGNNLHAVCLLWYKEQNRMVSRIYPSFTDCTPLGESPPIVCTKSPSSIFSQGHECQRRVRYWGRWGEQLILGIRQQLWGSPFSLSQKSMSN